jgi:hypothetical protein
MNERVTMSYVFRHPEDVSGERIWDGVNKEFEDVFQIPFGFGCKEGT